MPKVEYTILGLALLSSSLTCCLLIQSFRRSQSFISVAPNPSSNDDTENKSELINGAYRRIHQRYDRESWKWVAFDPAKESESQEAVAFNVYHRHVDGNVIRPVETLTEIKGESLREVLKSSLKRIDSVFDAIPLIDSQKLYNHQAALKKELGRLVSVSAAQKLEPVRPDCVRLDEIVSQPAGHASNESGLPTPIDKGKRNSVNEARSDSCHSGRTELEKRILHLQKFLDYLDEEFSQTREKLADLSMNHDISFGLLWCLFGLGTAVSFKDIESGLICAGEVTSAEYVCRRDYEFFEIYVRYIDYNGSTFYYDKQRLEIPFFKELRRQSWLAAQPLGNDRKLKDELKERGTAFVKLKGTHYLEYHDYLIQRQAIGGENRILKFRNPRLWTKLRKCRRMRLHLCAPTVLGYSFAAKMWGRLVANKFSAIRWNKNAFDHLVLPETTRSLIKGLIDADRENAEIVNDVISGKGGGCLIILHGRPGTGKTLTAEAIAEERQKPLMTISIGELSTDAAELEEKLTDILEISRLWKAVLLLDEADVFLEARSAHELHRNALVAVLLRLLEYHQRVMILTTNQVTCLDEAFKSRISIGIKYKDLDKNGRRRVWENFFTLAGVKIVDTSKDVIDEGSMTKEDINKLASIKLNGREIKNTMRTAQALALSLKQPFCFELLKRVIDLKLQFDSDYKKVDTVRMYDADGEGSHDHYSLYQ